MLSVLGTYGWYNRIDQETLAPHDVKFILPISCGDNLEAFGILNFLWDNKYVCVYVVCTYICD